MEDLSKYRGNSHSGDPDAVEAEPKKNRMQQVTTRPPTIKKPSVWKRVRESFIEHDDVSIGEYVLLEVIVPKVKDLVFDAGTEGLHQTLYRGSVSSVNRGSSRSVGGPSANRYHRPAARNSREAPEPRKRELDPRQRSTHDFSNLTFSNAGEAEEVADRLIGHIAEFGQASVNDFYDCIGMSGEFTDDNFGWTNLNSARVRKVRDGYILELPRTQELD